MNNFTQTHQHTFTGICAHRRKEVVGFWEAFIFAASVQNSENKRREEGGRQEGGLGVCTQVQPERLAPGKWSDPSQPFRDWAGCEKGI